MPHSKSKYGNSFWTKSCDKSRFGVSFSALVFLCCVAFISLFFQLGLYAWLSKWKPGHLQTENHAYKFPTSNPPLIPKPVKYQVTPQIFTETTRRVQIFSGDSPWEGVAPEYYISNFYTGSFPLPNENLCKDKAEVVKLLVLVPSSISNFQRRQDLRNTWGSFTRQSDVALGFVFGDPKLSQLDLKSLTTFQNEIDIYGDIIVADMLDSYKNLTLKVLYMVDWAQKYCSKARFYLKTDDDVFLNVPMLLKFIDKIKESDEQQPKIYGNMFSGHMPKRYDDKHHVGFEVYPRDMQFPNFTSGPAYLISGRVLQPLLKHAVTLPQFNLEDVFLTGFVASDLKIPRVNVTQFRNELENPFNMPACKVAKIFAGMTDGSSPQVYYVWYNYLMSKVICKNSVEYFE